VAPRRPVGVTSAFRAISTRRRGRSEVGNAFAWQRPVLKSLRLFQIACVLVRFSDIDGIRPVRMKRGWKILAGIVAIFAVCPQLPMRAQIGAPLQVDVRVRVKSNHGFGASFERQLDPGAATVEGRIHNLPGGETAVVTLRFDYRTNADFALDEIISQIVISIEDASGNAFSIATIDPNTIPLNPNRASLYYSATLYTPRVTRRAGYIAHVQVYGNYE
jgi:hypothetical protein